MPSTSVLQYRDQVFELIESKRTVLTVQREHVNHFIEHVKPYLDTSIIKFYCNFALKYQPIMVELNNKYHVLEEDPTENYINNVISQVDNCSQRFFNKQKIHMYNGSDQLNYCNTLKEYIVYFISLYLPESDGEDLQCFLEIIDTYSPDYWLSGILLCFEKWLAVAWLPQ